MNNTNENHNQRTGSDYGRIAAESRIQLPTQPPSKLPKLPPDCPVCSGLGYNKHTHTLCDACDGEGSVANLDGQATKAEASHD